MREYSGAISKKIEVSDHISGPPWSTGVILGSLDIPNWCIITWHGPLVASSGRKKITITPLAKLVALRTPDPSTRRGDVAGLAGFVCEVCRVARAKKRR